MVTLMVPTMAAMMTRRPFSPFASRNAWNRPSRFLASDSTLMARG